MVKIDSSNHDLLDRKLTTHVVGMHEDCLNEVLQMSTQNMFSSKNNKTYTAHNQGNILARAVKCFSSSWSWYFHSPGVWLSYELLELVANFDSNIEGQVYVCI